MKRGFDTKQYSKAQTLEILKRAQKFDKLYLEIGGKLLSDDHASRVLPGYNRTCKLKIIRELQDPEIIYCINTKDLISKRHVGRYNLTTEEKALKDLVDLEILGFKPKVVITRFEKEKSIKNFVTIIKKMKLRVYLSSEIANYGDTQATLAGYRKQKLIPTKSKLIVITGVGSDSGKMGLALSQIYKEQQKEKKKKIGFTKFESFPVWNLPISHPINLAYEAATADVKDKNMIDPYHKKAYKKNATNYNRDIENFGILQKILKQKLKSKLLWTYQTTQKKLQKLVLME